MRGCLSAKQERKIQKYCLRYSMIGVLWEAAALGLEEKDCEAWAWGSAG